ncbi:hypothetical protein TYRP_021331 [Tyrophagus putrescentiae]|nr:hypothetical protein TYRP_021331 [Tyrophagus putrescentiae]
MKTITAFVFFAMVSVACAQLYGRGFGLNGSYNRGIGLVGNGVYNSGASFYGTGVNGAYHNGRSIGFGGTFGPSATLGSIGFGQGYDLAMPPSYDTDLVPFWSEIGVVTDSDPGQAINTKLFYMIVLAIRIEYMFHDIIAIQIKVPKAVKSARVPP